VGHRGLEGEEEEMEEEEEEREEHKGSNKPRTKILWCW